MLFKIHTFKSKLVFLVAIAILLPTVISFVMLSYSRVNQLNELANVHLSDGLTSIEVVLQSKENELIQGLERIAQDNTLQVTVDLLFAPQLQNYLEMHLEVMHFSSLSVYLKDKKIFSASTTSDNYGLAVPAEDFSKELHIVKFDNNLYLQTVRPIHKGSELIGYVSGAICLTSPHFIDFLYNVISHDFIIWFNDKCLATSFKKSVKLATLNTPIEVGFTTVEIQDQSYRALNSSPGQIRYSILESAGYDWGKEAVIFGSIFLLMAISFLIIFQFLKTYMSELSTPVTELTQAAAAITDGHQGVPQLNYQRDDEFGILNNTFKKMFISQHDYIKDIEAKNVELDKLNRVKTDFLATMSHEIRTPMNGVVGMVDMLRCTNIDEKQKGYLDIMWASTDNLLKIINDILDFSKVNTGNMTLEKIECDIADVMTGVYEILLLKSNTKGLDFNLELPSIKHLFVLTDPTRLRQVLLNLVDNAIKFTKKGAVTLSCDVVNELDNTITLKFSVSDTGIGIPEEQLPYLFEAFNQLDASTTRRYGGTGLGLAICERLAKLMGAQQISVESTPGVTTIFEFTLELGKIEFVEKKDTTNHAIQPAKWDNTPKDSVRILVVEDDQLNQAVTKSFLSVMGYDFDIVENGYLAVQAVKKNSYDLVLMDWHMPVMDGVEATKAIREYEANGPRTSIVGLSASAMLGDSDICIAAGMDDYLSKPLSKSEFERIANKWITENSKNLDS